MFLIELNVAAETPIQTAGGVVIVAKNCSFPEKVILIKLFHGVTPAGDAEMEALDAMEAEDDTTNRACQCRNEEIKKHDPVFL